MLICGCYKTKWIKSNPIKIKDIYIYEKKPAEMVSKSRITNRRNTNVKHILPHAFM